MALSFYLPASAGQLSAGQGGFMALGAYTAAYLTVQHGAPFPLALAAGGLVGGPGRLAGGSPPPRRRGLLPRAPAPVPAGGVPPVFPRRPPARAAPAGFAGIPPATT